MNEDRTSPNTAPNAAATTKTPKPVSRPARIAAVTATTALLMTTTAVGIAAVTQALQPQAPTFASAEAATSVPVRISPTLASAASLPDLGSVPALPSIKKILKSIKSGNAPVVSNVVPDSADSTTATVDPGQGEPAEHESAKHEKGESTPREHAEQGSDD